MRKSVWRLACVVLLAGGAVLAESTRPTPGGGEGSPASRPAPATVHGTVHSIRMPELPFDLPAGANRDEVVVYCGSCHTTRYIMIQPPFARQTWLAEVTKMRTAFAAPIPQEKVKGIVDYLTAVRGPDAQ